MYSLINPLIIYVACWEPHLIDTICKEILNKQWHRLPLKLSLWDIHNYGNTDTDALGDVMASEDSLNLMQSHPLSYGSFILI